MWNVCLVRLLYGYPLPMTGACSCIIAILHSAIPAKFFFLMASAGGLSFVAVHVLIQFMVLWRDHWVAGS